MNGGPLDEEIPKAVRMEAGPTYCNAAAIRALRLEEHLMSMNRKERRAFRSRTRKEAKRAS